jgi:cell division septation protein DedD
MSAEDQAREFELVLGNKQLFIVLLIVVVLLGVFFAMGYVMGRSSSPVDVGARPAESRAETGTRRSAVETPRQTTPAAPTATDSNSYPLPTPGAASSQPAAPAAAQPAPASAASKPLEVAPVSVIEPAPGTIWLQVSAVAKPEAELLVEVLVKKGFKAVVAAGPTDKVFRVLVGPLKDVADVGTVKGDLEQSGFKSMVRRY